MDFLAIVELVVPILVCVGAFGVCWKVFGERLKGAVGLKLLVCLGVFLVSALAYYLTSKFAFDAACSDVVGGLDETTIGRARSGELPRRCDPIALDGFHLVLNVPLLFAVWMMGSMVTLIFYSNKKLKS